MTISAADLSTLSRLLDQALDLAPAEVEGWILALPAEHRHLLPTLRGMLSMRPQQTDAGFLAEGPRLEAADGSVAQAGDQVGSYRLIREIGRGGMGAVWLAERADGSLKRHIALKLPRLSWGAGLSERMARERDIGALLEHPNIGRLYDAGVDALGRPYLALEYIDGQPIDAWCDAHALGIRERLRLFLQVVRAVAYAHGRLVVHRDLKPSNVLVSADGQAHLLDFGIAKLLQGDGPGSDRLTQDQGRVLTPYYASPEQLRGQAVSVVSDVYSLGTLLFELLTGQHPYDLKRNSLAALEEAVLEREPVAASRRARDKVGARALRGEIDSILAKALRREPERRYATANALAEDIERHLAGERVLAQPDTRLYRISKTFRRHWLSIAGGSALVLAIVVGSLAVAVQAQRAARAAERERVITDFMTDVFRINRPRVARSTKEPVHASPQSLVEGAARLIETRFAEQPELQADLYGVVGDVFSDMGAFRLATDYARRRADSLARLQGDAHERARSVLSLAHALFSDERVSEADAAARSALELAGDDALLRADAQVLQARAQIELGKLADAAALLDQADALLARTVGGPVAARAWAQAARARLLVIGNRQDDAIASYQKAIDIALAAEGPLSPTAVSIRLTIAFVLAETVSYAEQARGFFEPADWALRAAGGPHAIRAALEAARFVALRNQLVDVDTPAQVMTALNGSRAALAAVQGSIPDWFIPQVDYWIGVIKVNNGEITDGLALLESSAPLLLKVFESPNRRRRIATFYGRTLSAAGQHERADGFLREALEARRRSGLARHPWAAVNYNDLASNLMMQGRYADAEAELDQAPAFDPIRGEGMNPVRYSRSLVWMRARIRLAAGKPAQALQLLQQSAPGDQEHPEELGRYRPALAEALCGVGRHAEGLVVFRAQLASDEKLGGSARDPRQARRRAMAGLCALESGDRSAAAAWGAQAAAAFAAQPGVSPYYKTPSELLTRRLVSRQAS